MSKLIDLTFFDEKEAPQEAPFFWKRDSRRLTNVDHTDRKLIFEQRKEVNNYGLGVNEHQSL